MAKKIKLTRPELKRQRDALARFERYLPMLKLKQQMLQVTLRKIQANLRRMEAERNEAIAGVRRYQAVLADRTGVNLRNLAKPDEVRTTTQNVAGVRLPVFEEVTFPDTLYSLFATPGWVDRALKDLRHLNRAKAECDVLEEQYRLLDAELTKIIQRVNLFEKVKIPECREAIRRIRIQLGDEMTAAVGRAKIAKGKLAETEGTIYEAEEIHAEPSEGL
ncbi:MAG: V-type ATP synthase subunit D [Phycisphaerae bacterium]